MPVNNACIHVGDAWISTTIGEIYHDRRHEYQILNACCLWRGYIACTECIIIAKDWRFFWASNDGESWETWCCDCIQWSGLQGDVYDRVAEWMFESMMDHNLVPSFLIREVKHWSSSWLICRGNAATIYDEETVRLLLSSVNVRCGPQAMHYADAEAVMID